MRLTRRGKVARGLLLAGTVALVAGMLWTECLLVWAGTGHRTWNTYRGPQGTVQIRTRCMAEDSLGHLRLRSLDTDVVQLGCARKGY